VFALSVEPYWKVDNASVTCAQHLTRSPAGHASFEVWHEPDQEAMFSTARPFTVAQELT
jgi:hypothetical protein